MITMSPGTCECMNGHRWHALVVGYDDAMGGGVHVSTPKCPECDTEFIRAAEGYRYDDLLAYCAAYGDSIFVRVGAENRKFSEMESDEQMEHVARWFRARHIPIRLLSDKERDDAKREAAEED